jgi:hypothetical protein
LALWNPEVRGGVHGSPLHDYMRRQFNQVGGFTLYLAKIHFNIIPSARTEISPLVKRPETDDWCSVLGSGMDFSLRHHVHTNFGSFECPLGPRDGSGSKNAVSRLLIVSVSVSYVFPA